MGSSYRRHACILTVILIPDRQIETLALHLSAQEKAQGDAAGVLTNLSAKGAGILNSE